MTSPKTLARQALNLLTTLPVPHSSRGRMRLALLLLLAALAATLLGGCASVRTVAAPTPADCRRWEERRAACRTAAEVGGVLAGAGGVATLTDAADSRGGRLALALTGLMAGATAAGAARCAADADKLLEACR